MSSVARAGDDDVDARDRLLAEISALESRPPGGDSATLESPPSRKASAAARRRRAGARGGYQGKGLCRRCFLCGLNFELVVVGIVGLLMASKLAESPVQQQLHGHHGQVGRWLENSDSHAIFYIAMVAFSSIAIGLLGWGAVCSGNETAATCHFVAMLLLSCLSLWFVVFLAVSCCPVTLRAMEASLNTTHQLESGDNGCAGPGKSGGRTLSEGCWAELAGEEHAATGSSHDLHAAMSVRYERNLCHTQATATQPTVGKVSKRVNLRARPTLVVLQVGIVLVLTPLLGLCLAKSMLSTTTIVLHAEMGFNCVTLAGALLCLGLEVGVVTVAGVSLIGGGGWCALGPLAAPPVPPSAPAALEGRLTASSQLRSRNGWSAHQPRPLRSLGRDDAHDDDDDDDDDDEPFPCPTHTRFFCWRGDCAVGNDPLVCLPGAENHHRPPARPGRPAGWLWACCGSRRCS
jgi:hypothetical protein